MAPRDGDVLGRHAVEDANLIPARRDCFQKIELLLPVVGVGGIRHHLQAAFEDHKQRGGMGARVHHHGRRGARLELLARHVAKSAGSVIHRPRQHAGEGERHVVPGSHSGAPAVILRAHHTFARHNIGKGAGTPVGLRRAVKVDHDGVRRLSWPPRGTSSSSIGRCGR